jgi:epoxyqueuosine reductase
LFEAWVAEGKYGDMTWMARNVDKRGDPRLVLPGAQSVIVLAYNYCQGSAPEVPYRIARYAWNEDYHELIWPKLRVLEDCLKTHGGEHRSFVDTGPVLERDFASEAGLGWGGKSTMQIHPKLGTWFFLSTLLTTLELEPDAPAKDRCGSCTRCITACPTQAITGPRQMDARRCISYLTIEHNGSIDEALRPLMGNHIYGCDDCQLICPWNKFAQASSLPDFDVRAGLVGRNMARLLAWTEAEFLRHTEGSPIRRIGHVRWLRNLAVATGNALRHADDAALREALLAHLTHSSEVVREHVQWALAQ